MVTPRTGPRSPACLRDICALTLATAASATVTASIDRDRIESNESFTLKITVDSTADLAPDLAVLEQDFEVGQTSQLTEAHIVNGAVSRSVSWSVVLTPRRAGLLSIPALTIGTEQSEPLTITVVEPAKLPPGEADVFLASELDFDETYVQAQVLYRIRIYRAVATRQPALREPVFSGAEVLVEQASDERNYEAVLNGRAYNVVEYVFALFPQESGEVSISPARFEARVLRDGRITGRKLFESDSHVLKVNPIPPPPPEHPDAAWLPARDVSLTQNWSREPEGIEAGEPISRDITVSALGQLETQIPVIDPPAVDGINVYPDRPVLSRELEADGIRGVRTDQYAMIGAGQGVVTLPPIELPWWDVTAGAWRVATLPAQELDILPSPNAPEPPTAAEPAAVAADPGAVADAGPAPPPRVAPGYWRPAAMALGLAWLATLAAWWSVAPAAPRATRAATGAAAAAAGPSPEGRAPRRRGTGFARTQAGAAGVGRPAVARAAAAQYRRSGDARRRAAVGRARATVRRELRQGRCALERRGDGLGAQDDHAARRVGRRLGRRRAAAADAGLTTSCRCSASTPRARRAARRSPACRISIEISSGERTKAMWPSRGGRLIVTPLSLSFPHSA